MLVVGLAATAALGAVTTAVGTGALRWVVAVGSAALDVALFTAASRVLTPRQVCLAVLWPGAAVAGVGYSILLTIGTGLVQHQLREERCPEESVDVEFRESADDRSGAPYRGTP